MSIGIYSKRCWLEGQLKEATIFFENGKITRVADEKIAAENIHDVGEQVVMPGVIDAHVHVNEPGRTDWEGFDTASQAAAAGGITTIVDMPLNASPVTTTAEALKQKLSSTSGKLHVNAAFYGGVIPGNEDEIQGLIEAGVVGIKAFLTHSGIDEFPNVTEKELNACMPLLAKHNIPLLVHCELDDKDHAEDLSKHPTSYKSYLASRPKKWENDAVDMMIGLCRKHNCRTHIVHVSSAEALDNIAKAKAEGLLITAETCPHYIYFNAEEIPDAATIYKCAPPIRETANNKQLKEALHTGVLDFLSTDHSPAPPSIKEIESGNLQKAWGGIAGLQFLLSASWTALKDTMTLEKFIPLLTANPAVFLQLNHHKGFLKEGYDADIVVWSPEESNIVTEDEILHKHKISPYVGQQLYGKVYQTYVSGELVYSDNQIKQKNIGKWLLRK
jgi:allantoinase